MKAIETWYKGRLMRSRLEARWAVFFETLGLKWEHEPEGFELPGGYRYLPDFLVTYPGRVPSESYQVWFEVKRGIDAVTEDEWRKMRAFDEMEDLIILDGSPDVGVYLTVKEILTGCPDDLAGRPETIPLSKENLRRSTDTDRSGLCLWSHKQRLWWTQRCNLEKDLGDEAFAYLQKAVDAALSARFERFSK